MNEMLQLISRSTEKDTLFETKRRPLMNTQVFIQKLSKSVCRPICDLYSITNYTRNALALLLWPTVDEVRLDYDCRRLLCIFVALYNDTIISLPAEQICFVFSLQFSLFFSFSVPYHRLSWLFVGFLSTRKWMVSYCNDILHGYCGENLKFYGRNHWVTLWQNSFTETDGWLLCSSTMHDCTTFDQGSVAGPQIIDHGLVVSSFSCTFKYFV